MKCYASFAEILDYPGPELTPALDEAVARLQCARPEPAKLLGDFKETCEHLGPNQLQELYVSTFELRADCSLYAGYHLLGDDWRRSFFLAELKRRYDTVGFSCGRELPDHVPVLLRFLSVQTDPEEESALRSDCLIPAIEKVAARLEPRLNPYRTVLDALLLFLAEPSSNRTASPADTKPEALVL